MKKQIWKNGVPAKLARKAQEVERVNKELIRDAKAAIAKQVRQRSRSRSAAKARNKAIAAAAKAAATLEKLKTEARRYQIENA